MTQEGNLLDKLAQDYINEYEEANHHPTGIGRITRGECSLGSKNALACKFCLRGHQMNCHYPRYCWEEICDFFKEVMPEVNQK